MWMAGHASMDDRRHPHATHIPVHFRSQRTRAKCDYTHVTMVMRRCGFYAIRCACLDRFFTPPPRVGPQRCQQRVTWSHGFTFPCVPSAHLHRADGGHPRRVCDTHSCWPRPAKTARRNHRSGHHSSIALTSYVYVTLRSTQSWSKMNNSIQ